MRYTYTVTKKCCPVCGTVLESDDPVGWYILGFILFPLIAFAIPFFIARWVLKNFVLCVDIPYVCKQAHVRCPKCGTIVRINNKPTYDELDDEDKLQYDNRGVFRMAYFSGGMLILSIALSFFLTASDPTSKTIGTVFLCLAFVWLLVILVIVFYWKSKRKSLENISKTTSTEAQQKGEEVPQRSKVGWLEKNDEGERQRAIERYEKLKKENEARKKLEAEQVQRQKNDEEERRRAIERYEKLKKENETRKKLEAEQAKIKLEEQAKKQKIEQETATCKALLEECGMQFFIRYYPQLKRLPISNITVSDHYFPERQVRLTAAKKIVDLGLTECALRYIIETYSDIFSSEVIERAKSILDEIKTEDLQIKVK